MGQKINPTIFRLGVNKTWKTEFFEKKNHELPLYVFKDLEIRNYIERVLETYGIIVHDYKQHYNGSTLNLYVSYFVRSDFISNKQGIAEVLTVRNNVGEKKTVKNSRNYGVKQPYFLPDKNTIYLSEDASRLYKLKQYLNSTTHFEQDNVSFQKTPFKEFSQTNLKSSGIFDQVFEVLDLFSNSQLNVTLNFCCANKDLYFLKFSKEKIFMSLQKFRNTPFFKEGIELLFNVTHNSNSANLLAKFIVFQLKKIKRQKFFLSFLKQSLTILSNSDQSKIKGVKIMIKGRLNGVPRAKQKMIVIGDVPTQSIAAKVDYSQATMHNSNGSYGIQVWVAEK